MFFQNGLTGEAWGDWSLYTDSPLRALTSAQECIAGTGGPFPEDFWDPAGITTGKSCLVDLELDGGCLKLIIFVQLPHIIQLFNVQWEWFSTCRACMSIGFRGQMKDWSPQSRFVTSWSPSSPAINTSHPMGETGSGRPSQFWVRYPSLIHLLPLLAIPAFSGHTMSYWV